MGDKVDSEVTEAAPEVNVKVSLAKRVPGFGIILSLLSTLIINLNFVLIKQMTEIHPLEYLFYRAVFTSLFVLPGQTAGLETTWLWVRFPDHGRIG